MPLDIEVGLATEEDLEEILAVQLLAFAEPAENISKWYDPAIETLEELKEDFKKRTIFKATHAGKIIASSRAMLEENGDCPITRVSVHPDYQGKTAYLKMRALIFEHFRDAKRFIAYTVITPTYGHKYLRYLRMSGWTHFKTDDLGKGFQMVFFECKGAQK